MSSELSKKFPNPVYAKYVLDPYFEDARKLYFQPMVDANKTHVIMLSQNAIISQENASALLMAIAQVEEEGADRLVYAPGVEDLFFAMENRIIEIAGKEFGGNLQLARSRNDLGYALTRLAIRPAMLSVMEHLLIFRRSLVSFAKNHLHTLMPGYTHGQPAQPSTMAHYFAGVSNSLARDTERFDLAFRFNNASPLGAAAFTGTGFPIDRQLSADLLGFDSVIGSTYDSIAASDNLIDVANVLTSMGITLSRFIKDLLFWATKESNALEIDESFIQISSIMPQKRNPVVLEHLRARVSRMLGYSHTIVIQSHNIPFGDTQDIEDEILPSLFGAMTSAVEILDLFTAVVDTLKVNKAHLALRAEKSFIAVTELADTLVREHKLPFRKAHHIVSRLVTLLMEAKMLDQPVPVAMLQKAAEEILGNGLPITQQDLDDALDPLNFIKKRDHLGGASPSATEKILNEQSEILDKDFETLSQKIDRITRASENLKALGNKHKN